MIPVNHNGLFFPQDPLNRSLMISETRWDASRSSLLCQITQTHTSANTQAQLQAHVHENTTESLFHKGSEYLDTDILHLGHGLQQFKLHNSNTYLSLTIWQPLVPFYVAEMISISGEQGSAVQVRKRIDF